MSFFSSLYVCLRDRHSFPTRRSSDLYPKGTLVNALLNYTKKLANEAGENRPGIVHRLDKDTSGLLVVAKTNIARSEEHTSELQSRGQLVCRLLLEKKKQASCAEETTN